MNIQIPKRSGIMNPNQPQALLCQCLPPSTISEQFFLKRNKSYEFTSNIHDLKMSIKHNYLTPTNPKSQLVKKSLRKNPSKIPKFLEEKRTHLQEMYHHQNIFLNSQNTVTLKNPHQKISFTQNTTKPIFTNFEPCSQVQLAKVGYNKIKFGDKKNTVKRPLFLSPPSKSIKQPNQQQPFGTIFIHGAASKTQILYETPKRNDLKQMYLRVNPEEDTRKQQTIETEIPYLLGEQNKSNLSQVQDFIKSIKQLERLSQGSSSSTSTNQKEQILNADESKGEEQYFMSRLPVPARLSVMKYEGNKSSINQTKKSRLIPRRQKTRLKKMNDVQEIKSMIDQNEQPDDNQQSFVLDRLHQYGSHFGGHNEDTFSSQTKIVSQHSTTFKSMLKNFGHHTQKGGHFGSQFQLK